MTFIKQNAGLLRSVRSWGVLGLVLALVVSAGVGSGQMGPPCVPPPPGMVAWYPLDEQAGATSVNDIAPGFNNVGTPYDANGAPTSVSATPGPPPAGPVPVTAPPLNLPSGMVGNALYFYGPYIQVGNHPDLNFGTGPFSIDAWVYYVPLSPVPPGSGPFIAPIVDKFDPNTNKGFALFLYIDTAGTHLRFRMWDGTNFSVAGFPVPTIPPLTWGHIVVTVDRPGPGVSVYINGTAAVTGAPMVPGSIDNNEPLWIGKSRLHTLLNAGFREIAIDELEIFNRVLTPQEVQALFNAGAAGKCKEQPPAEATADLGDAPDSTNHSGKAMTTYTPSVTAKFPTVFDPATGLPQGPKHLQPKGLAWLGPDVSFENEADLMPDADGITNIDPSSNAADRDKFDDGVALPIAIPMVCGQTQFQYTVTSTAAAKLYVNVWFDFNRDGDWDDPMQKCPLGPAVTGSFTEWAVQNQVIAVNPGLNTFTTPVFGAANPTKGSEMWMRITLTDQPIAPANGDDGSGPASGYKYGETEDYLLRLTYSELCGIKFNDLNGNGKQDSGEPGLANWVIEVKDANGNIIGYAVTDANGRYCIVVPSPGTYTVSEQLQPGWTQTFPVNPPTHTVTVPPAATNINFGNQEKKEKAEMCIFKFNDLNGNGVRDLLPTPEPLLGGWQFTVAPAPLPPATSPVTTLPGGGICFGVSAPGTYTITEIVQSGWTPTTPNPQTVTVQPGQLVNVFFGNQKKDEKFEICGIKWNDLDGDGVQDPGEPVLPGWTINMVFGTPPNQIDVQATTDANGRYCFTGLAPGTYTISETPQPGWIQTFPPSPGKHTVTVPPSVTNINFGNKQVGKCDLQIRKTVSPNPVNSGQPITVTLTVQNVGTAPCGPDTVVQDPPTTGLNVPLQPVSVSQSGTATWACLPLGGGVQCVTASTLPPGYSATFTFTATPTVAPPPGGSVEIRNCATVNNPNDPLNQANPGNNQSCVTITVRGVGIPVDLTLAKLLDGQLRSQQEATYVLRVQNVGGAPTTGPIQVTDPLPPTLLFVAATGMGWSCSASGQNVTCISPEPLAPGQISTILLRVRVAAPAGTQITNCATVAAAGDANPANNRGCHTGTVQR